VKFSFKLANVSRSYKENKTAVHSALVTYTCYTQWCNFEWPWVTYYCLF